VNKTLNNLLSDCNNNIHFTKRFFDEYSNELNDQLIEIIKELNSKIYNEFVSSYQMINITSEFDLLNHFVGLIGLNYIQNHFNKIDQIFTQIIEQNNHLSISFLNKTLNQVKQYFILLQFIFQFLFSFNYLSKMFFNQQLIHVRYQWMKLFK
jgi:hypothetical protein